MARVGVSLLFDGVEEANDVEAGFSHHGVLSGRDVRRVFGLLGCRESQRRGNKLSIFPGILATKFMD
jgi:hypothetical protein